LLDFSADSSDRYDRAIFFVETKVNHSNELHDVGFVFKKICYKKKLKLKKIISFAVLMLQPIIYVEITGIDPIRFEDEN